MCVHQFAEMKTEIIDSFGFWGPLLLTVQPWASGQQNKAKHSATTYGHLVQRELF